MQTRSLAIALFLLVCAATPAQAGVRIALLPIAVHAAGEESAYLQSGLAEMIASRLDQYEGVVVARPRIEGAPTATAEAAREVAKGVGADFVLFGSFTRFGDGASLDLRCARVANPGDSDAAQEAARRLFIQSGSLAEIIPQLDTLAQKVARYTIGAGGAAPRVAGTDADKAAPAASGPSQAEYQALLQRVETLERALIPPVAEKAEEGGVVVR